MAHCAANGEHQESSKQTHFNGERDESTLNNEHQPAPARNLERTRILTMKYPKHQMMLIKKRIAVEDWFAEKVDELLDGDEELISKIDELLDLRNDGQRRQYLEDYLSKTGCKLPSKVVESFINESVKKLATL